MSNHKRGGTTWVKHDKILITKQADFVNKELSSGNGIMAIKKIVTPNKSVDAELDNLIKRL